MDIIQIKMNIIQRKRGHMDNVDIILGKCGHYLKEMWILYKDNMNIIQIKCGHYTKKMWTLSTQEDYIWTMSLRLLGLLDHFFIYIWKSCKSMNSFEDNFHNMFGNNIQCYQCKLKTDSQEHALQCSVMKNHIKIHSDIKYKHLFGTLEQQKRITHSSLLEIRERLLNSNMPTGSKISDQ